ncbi:MAG: omega amino acid--pyruvate aminotransferase [Gammaproteobacteria bacterium SG8_31]|jgi:beta-alanine--pyruvate transaminase|nr:MAG: omega amino acid--pyruvate aminotransferase [Gammaproteobacteria bacterium SG8_31]
MSTPSEHVPSTAVRPDMLPFWMPFTANRQFKSAPRLLSRAEGMHYYTPEGRKVLDGTAGLWCVNAGHGRKQISDAVARQIREMEYAPLFNMGHPIAFEFAGRLSRMAPEGLNKVFFTNSGSESVDTALKIAIAYHRVRGEGARQRLIGREKGYHGVGFGGISVGGMVNNRKFFGAMLPGVDHLRHTLDLEHNAFSRGLPEWGAELADDLQRIVELHDPSTIAAVIVEPVAGSAGVILPPVGYLQKLREICDRHGILLIFDEVITGFGRLGAPFAADYFDVMPDIITTAKGLTNGSIPMGAVFVRNEIYEAFMTGPEHLIELFHGYTYSGHPVACAAGLATMDIYDQEELFARAGEMAAYWEDAVHSLHGLPNVIDLRNLGLVAGIELASRAGAPGARAFDAHVKCFDKGVLVRFTGDIIALSPPLIIEKQHIDELFGTIGDVLKSLD